MAIDVNMVADSLFKSIDIHLEKQFDRWERRLLQLVSDRIEALPKPRDGVNGKDASADDVASAVQTAVVRVIESLPVPKDGVDGKTVYPSDVKAMVDAAVRDIPSPQTTDVDREFVIAAAKAAAMDALSGIRPPQDGKSVDIAEIRSMVDLAVLALPSPKDGQNGKDADPVDVASVARMAAAMVPIPKDGQPGQPGRDADPAAIDLVVNEKVRLAVEQIAKPRDGKDADPALIEQMVVAVVQKMPAPQPGKDGEPGRDATPEAIRMVVREEVARLPAPVNGKDADPEAAAWIALEKVMSALDQIPKPKDGKDADPAVIEQMVSAAVAKIPPAPAGKDADPTNVERLVADAVAKIQVPRDGKDADLEFVRSVIAEEVSHAVAALPSPKDGEPGKSVDVAQLSGEMIVAVNKAVGALPVPRNGKDFDPALMHQYIDGLLPALVDKAHAVVTDRVDAAVASIPKADDVHARVRDEVRRAMADLPKPKDGVDGKSFLIEDARSLLGGEFAKWALEFERRASDILQHAISQFPIPVDGRDGRDGADGFGLEDFSAEMKDERTLILKFSSDEQEKMCEVKLPVPIDRGVYKSGAAYEQGDSVTYGGSFWIAQKDTSEGPGGDSGDWRMAIRRPKDGKDAA